MTILSEAIFEEIKKIVKEEVSKDVNQVKLEDAKIIVQVLLPEIDRIITDKFNKFARRLATDVISWDIIEKKEEEPVVPEGYKFVDAGNASHFEPIEGIKM